MSRQSRRVRTVSLVNLEQAAWIAALVSVPVAVASAIVAIVARRDAKRAAGAAERSAQAAEDLTAIEQRRRHEELTPRLSVEATCWGPGSDRLRVTVRLDGPPGLDRLDHVAVRIRDDQDRSPVTAGGPTREADRRDDLGTVSVRTKRRRCRPTRPGGTRLPTGPRRVPPVGDGTDPVPSVGVDPRLVATGVRRSANPA